ncbi:MAG TPA: tetratricopeptide repeat protein, partial [Chloroflexota bacterium]|nr:tetratricopeptide repeat protein [Chloroflexota bacterium]
ELLDLAATIGRIFPLDVLAAAHAGPERELVRSLDDLWRLRIIRESGEAFMGAAGDSVAYEFSHALVREVAYWDMSPAQRVMRHRAVAEAEAHGSKAHPIDHLRAAAAARNFELAADAGSAGEWYRRAAEGAERLYAFDAAASYLRRAVGQSLGAEPEVLLALARNLQFSGERTEAEHYFIRALDVFRRRDDILGVSACRCGVAETLRLRGRAREGLVYLESARSELEGTGHHAALAHVLGLISESLIFLSELGGAEESAKKQLELSRQAAERREEASAFSNLATVAARRTQLAKALELYAHQLDLESSIGDQVRILRAEGLVGNVHRLRGHLETARAHFDRQLSLSEEIGYQEGVQRATFHLGLVAWQGGETEQAVEMFQSSLQIAHALGDRQLIGSSLGNLGLLYEELGQYIKASETLKEAREILLEVGDVRNAAIALGNLGVVYRTVGDWEAAELCLVASFEISFSIGNRQSVIDVAGVVAEVRMDRGELEDAEAVLTLVRDLARRLDMSAFLAVYLHDLSCLAKTRGRYDEALALNSEAARLATLTQQQQVVREVEALRIEIECTAERLTRNEAAAELEVRLAGSADPREQAELAHVLCVIDPANKRAVARATSLHEHLYTKYPCEKYRGRIEILTGKPPANSPPRLGEPPMAVYEYREEAQMVLERLRELKAGLPEPEVAEAG